METMPAYLVRLRANRDLVGIFVADDPEELEFVVYECTDVEACEYLEMPDGGIMWQSPAIPVRGRRLTRMHRWIRRSRNGRSDLPR